MCKKANKRTEAKSPTHSEYSVDTVKADYTVNEDEVIASNTSEPNLLSKIDTKMSIAWDPANDATTNNLSQAPQQCSVMTAGTMHNVPQIKDEYDVQSTHSFSRRCNVKEVKQKALAPATNTVEDLPTTDFSEAAIKSAMGKTTTKPTISKASTNEAPVKPSTRTAPTLKSAAQAP